MPETTTTVLQEWKRIYKLLDNPDNIENITDGELRFLKLNYDDNNEQIYRISDNIYRKLLNLIEIFTDKIEDSGTDRINQFKLLNKLYSSAIACFVFGKFLKKESEEIIERFKNFIELKIDEIESNLNESEYLEPYVIILRNTFVRLRRVMSIGI